MNCKFKNQIVLKSNNPDDEENLETALEGSLEIVAVLDDARVIVGERDCEHCPIKCNNLISAIEGIMDAVAEH